MSLLLYTSIDWTALKNARLHAPLADALVYSFLRCPRTGRVGVYRTESRAALDEDNVTEFKQLLTEAESARCLEQLGDGELLEF